MTTIYKWSHYFNDSQFVIRTDHAIPKHLKEQRSRNILQQKWLIKVMVHNYTMEYKKGKENKAVDALPRQYEQEESDLLTLKATSTKIEPQ